MDNMDNIHNANDLNQQVSNYMNIIRDSRFLINNIINMLQPDNYNESNNDIINNILNIMNNQNTTFLQYINYNIEVERLNVERQQQIERQQNRQYQLDRERTRNRSYYNRLRPRQTVGRTTSNINSTYDDIIHVFFTESNTNGDGDNGGGDNNVNLISPAQINIATEIMKFTDLSDDIKTNQTRCPISYHDFVNETEIILIKHCKHIFKKQSLLNWFLTSKCCPMCRYDLTTYTEITIDNSNNEIQT